MMFFLEIKSLDLFQTNERICRFLSSVFVSILTIPADLKIKSLKFCAINFSTFLH